jgi:hypothetical protein
VKQFLISPHQIGIPNRRIRYYLLARSSKKGRFSNRCQEIITSEDFFLSEGLIKQDDIYPTNLKTFLDLHKSHEEDFEINNNFYLTNKVKSNIFLPNIVNLNSTNSNCFTKAYSKLLRGSGSFLFYGNQIDQVKYL